MSSALRRDCGELGRLFFLGVSLMCQDLTSRTTTSRIAATAINLSDSQDRPPAALLQHERDPGCVAARRPFLGDTQTLSTREGDQLGNGRREPVEVLR